MKRNLLSRISRYSLLLFGTTVGLFTLASTTIAQTSDESPSVAWPNEFRLRVRTPDSMPLADLRPAGLTTAKLSTNESSTGIESENFIRTPKDLTSVMDRFGRRQNADGSTDQNSRLTGLRKEELNNSDNFGSELNPVVVKTLNKTPVLDTSIVKPTVPVKPQETANDSSIIVDSTVFEQYSVPKTDVQQPAVREIEPQAAPKFPIDNTLNAGRNAAEPFVPFTTMAIYSKPITNTPGRHPNMQISASAEQLERFSTAAIPTSIEIMDAKFANPTDVSANSPAPSIYAIDMNVVSKKFAQEPKMNLETRYASSAVTVFLEGPDSLQVDQTGDYYIAIINSASKSTSIPSIRLQIPEFAEILMIEREAQIDELERTITWNAAELASGQQERIRFRLKLLEAGEADFPVTIVQDGHDAQTISKTTSVK